MSDENIKITLPDLLVLTEDGEIKWIKCPVTEFFRFASYRALYKGRIYIVETSGRISVWNCRNDGLIWQNIQAHNLLNLIQK